MAPPLGPNEMYPAGIDGVSSRFIALRTGIRVRVVESGSPDGAPVLMLHGWGGLAYMYRHALSILPESGLRAIAVDLRGFGLSDKPPGADSYTLNSYRADLDALLDALDLDRVALIGQSMGGGLAARYAIDRATRIRKLVLINPACLVSLPIVAVARAIPMAVAEVLGSKVTRGMVEVTLRRVAYGDGSLVTDRDVDEYYAPTQLPGYAHSAHAALVEFDWSPLTDAEASRLAMPTLVVLGDNDRLIRTKPADAERLAGARVEVVPGGHCAHEEHPDLVYAMASAFFRRVDEPA